MVSPSVRVEIDKTKFYTIIQIKQNILKIKLGSSVLLYKETYKIKYKKYFKSLIQSHLVKLLKKHDPLLIANLFRKVALSTLININLLW